MATTSSGQTLNDRINSARYALAGQGLARCVCKATTEEVIGPKKKHLDYLVACTHEPNVSIPQLANLLIERTNHIYWVVVFKALVTVHHLMSFGNERFIQYLASSNYSFELSTFLDKTSARDFSMSTFIRRYSRYINEKALSYRLLAFDLCKVKRGNEGVLRTMPIDRLLKTLPILQNQLDALLEFDCSASDLNNGVINACFMLMFRDLIGLYACHSDGIINLLNKYFTLNKKMCREAFDLYKKFLVRMDKVSDFMRVAEVVGIDRDEIPDLRRAPSSLIDALEQHLQNLETNKKTLRATSSNSTSGEANNRSSGDLSLLGNLTPPSSSLVRPNSPNSIITTGGARSKSTTPITNATTAASLDEFTIGGLKDDEVRRALEEEARVLSQYHSNDGPAKLKAPLKAPPSASSSSSATTPNRDNNSPKFAVSSSSISVDDIFGDVDSFSASNSMKNNASNNNNNNNHPIIGPFSNSSFEKPKNGHNQLVGVLKPGNPFPETSYSAGFSSGVPLVASSAIPSSAGNQIFRSGNQTTGANYTNLGGLEGFGAVLQPISASNKSSTSSNPQPSGPGSTSNKSSFGGSTSLSSGLFKGDLDSTLANLAQNLTFDGLNNNKSKK